MIVKCQRRKMPSGFHRKNKRRKEILRLRHVSSSPFLTHARMEQRSRHLASFNHHRPTHCVLLESCRTADWCDGGRLGRYYSPGSPTSALLRRPAVLDLHCPHPHCHRLRTGNRGCAPARDYVAAAHRDQSPPELTLLGRLGDMHGCTRIRKGLVKVA